MFNLFELLNKLKKLVSRRDVLIVAGLLLLFFLTRLTKLTDLPIFTDEAIYIHWAKLAWKDASWRFVSLTDGRQPLQTWATIPFLKLFEADPLLAGRLFGVFSGLFALIGLFFLSYYLFGKKAAFIASLIYILNPYYLFYDRMALADSVVNGFFVWFIFFCLVLIKHQRLDLALIFGMLAGLGTLAKSTVRLFFLPFVFGPLVYLKNKSFYYCINNSKLKTENKIYSITAPTGIGKTYISFGTALKLKSRIKENFGRDFKIHYVLPFTTIIDQNYDEFYEILNITILQ